MAGNAKGMNCVVVEWMKCNPLRWFGHMERMQDRELKRRMYDSMITGTGMKTTCDMRKESGRILE